MTYTSKQHNWDFSLTLTYWAKGRRLYIKSSQLSRDSGYIDCVTRQIVKTNGNNSGNVEAMLAACGLTLEQAIADISK